MKGVDKQGGLPVAGPRQGGLRQLISNHGLIDLGFIGCPFTWNNKRSGLANIQERLDRGFSNDEWRLVFPEATITHLPAIQSDHKPLQLQLQPTIDHLPKPFKFESMWISHLDTGYIIEEDWNLETHFGACLKHTKNALRDWNKRVFGNLQLRIKDTRANIIRLQSASQDASNIQAEKEAQGTLDTLLAREEQLWKDKVKACWLDEGDANTHYFHLMTVIHRRYNAISALSLSDNTWVHSRQAIGDAFREYFHSLFRTVEPHFPLDFNNLITNSITPKMNQYLMKVPDAEEVQKAVFEMGNYKSPGPDDMTVVSCKTYWGIVREAVIAEVRRFFTSASLKLAYNHTFITLIPKTSNATSVDQYRPIALCNVIFKIITKIIASRL